MHDLTPLVGAEVRRICLDFQVTLELVVGPGNAELVSASLQIEAPLTLQRGADVLHCDPNEKDTHGVVTSLLHQVVSSAVVDTEDALHVTFDDGSLLSVPRDQHYESWHLTGAGVPQILMGPG